MGVDDAFQLCHFGSCSTINTRHENDPWLKAGENGGTCGDLPIARLRSLACRTAAAVGTLCATVRKSQLEQGSDGKAFDVAKAHHLPTATPDTGR